MRSGTQNNRERGAITVAETLIALAIAASILITWAYLRSAELTSENARLAGRMIAAYSRAAAEWLSEAPPATAGDYGIGSLQDCADPAGARYLSCTFPSTSRIPFAFTTAGTPVSLGDLVIRVTLGTDGAAGDIDFGIIRRGEDTNDDGLPDSRPDIAAIAHRVASEETGAGVTDFFELVFARDDPTGLVFDPTDPAFDQAAIDDMARLQARVGASVNAPFLRTDGSNDMQAGITFVNGVQIVPGTDNLAITGGTGLVVDTAITVPTLTATDISASATLTVDPVGGVLGAGFDRFDQAQAVTDNTADIASQQTSIATIETNVAANLARIEANTDAIEGANCTPTEAMAQERLRQMGPQCTHPSHHDNGYPARCYRRGGTWTDIEYYVRNLDTEVCEPRQLRHWRSCVITDYLVSWVIPTPSECVGAPGI